MASTEVQTWPVARSFMVTLQSSINLTHSPNMLQKTCSEKIKVPFGIGHTRHSISH